MRNLSSFHLSKLGNNLMIFQFSNCIFCNKVTKILAVILNYNHHIINVYLEIILVSKVLPYNLLPSIAIVLLLLKYYSDIQMIVIIQVGEFLMYQQLQQHQKVEKLNVGALLKSDEILEMVEPSKIKRNCSLRVIYIYSIYFTLQRY